MSENYTIKVGIDFGTTYSGVAWVHTSKPDEVSVLQSWPQGRGRKDSDKVPTEIVYDARYTPHGYVWGFDATTKTNKIEWVKLLLDPSQENRDPRLSLPLRRIKESIPPGKKPVDIVTDYLLGLERHTRETLDRTYGTGVLEGASIEYTLTVPAVWSDAAKALTLEAAERAGLGSKGRLRLLSEPEAAAVYTLASIQPNHLRIGNTFVVADCGGGTVDLISYKITQLEPKLQVHEYTFGGGLCGSSFINRGFEDWVARKVGIQYRVKMSDQGRRLLLKEFDEIKKSFSDEDGEDEYNLPAAGLDDDDDAGIEGGLLAVTNENMKGIMDPVVNEVVGLVQEQVTMVEDRGADCVSAILLVGGFGGSEYLRERLEKEVKARNGRQIPLLRPINPWTAVVRGAVLRSLEGSPVSTNLSRRHYGVAYATRFVDGFHPLRDKFWCPFEDAWYCRNRAQWYIHKNSNVTADKEIKFPFIKTLPVNCKLDAFSVTLYSCDKDQAPLSVNDESVKANCELPYSLSSVPNHLFTKRKNASGMEYLVLEFNIVMNIKFELLVFSVEVGGVKYGAVAPKFNS